MDENVFSRLDSCIAELSETAKKLDNSDLDQTAQDLQEVKSELLEISRTMLSEIKELCVMIAMQSQLEQINQGRVVTSDNVEHLDYGFGTIR